MTASRDKGIILKGRRAIADYLRMSERTVARKIRDGSLRPYVVDIGGPDVPRWAAWVEDLHDYLLGIPRRAPPSADDIRSAS
jgi:hypothetical protein